MANIKALYINGQRLMEDIHQLAAIGQEAGKGITRSSFSAPYQEAVDWLIAGMQSAGMTTRIDAVGNVIGRLGPDDGKIIMTGSHIDTVRNGGPLDGSYGVLAALEVARMITENNIELAKPYEVVAFVEEEGSYLSLFGARAMTGQISEHDIATAKNPDGVSLCDAMKAYGFDPAAYKEALYPKNIIEKYVELHIEQGPVLENEHKDIGVVEGIIALRVVDFCFFGHSNHAGTTPMHMRKDAFQATAEFITRAYKKFSEHQNDSSRMTFGSVALKPNAANVIPREALVRMDSRDLDEDTLFKIYQHMRELACQVADKYGLDVQIEEQTFDHSALMAPALVNKVKRATAALGYSYKCMPSGAGHDAQALAQVCDAGMIFVPSKNGLSHHPDEWTEPDHLVKGANVLLRTLLTELAAEQ